MPRGNTVAMLAGKKLIVPTLCVGMQQLTLQRLHYKSTTIKNTARNEDAGASSDAFQRGALER
jgi:hypothetical protein